MIRPDHPPRRPGGHQWLVRWLAHPRDRECVLADLDEEFETRWHRDGAHTARRWYRQQVRRSVIPMLERRLPPWRPLTPFSRSAGGRPRRQSRPMGMRLVDGLVHDLRTAGRTLSRRKGFTAFAILTTGLAIGAATAVYSSVDWLLNRPPGGVPQPDRLVTLRTTNGQQRLTFSFRQYELIHRVQDSFIDLAAYAKITGVLSSHERSDEAVFEFVSGNYFGLLGLVPALGRVIAPPDDVRGGVPGVMISHALWHSRFGGDPAVIDRDITLNGQRARVIGVVRRDFVGYGLDWNGPTDVWLPIQSYPALYQSNMLERVGQGGIFFPLIGRLRAGESFETAAQKAQAWVPQLETGPNDTYTANAVVLLPSTASRISRRVVAWEFFRVLLAVCALILLSACFNVANFLIGHVTARRREIAVRRALGASRLRVARQLLLEAALIGLGAAVVGVVVAIYLVRLASELPRIFLLIPVAFESVIDVRLLITAAVTGLGAALLFGVVPALLACLRNPVTDLKHSRPPWNWGRVRITARQCLLALQVSLAVVLAITAGLYTRSLWRITEVDPGYPTPERVLMARVVTYGMSADRGMEFWPGLLTTLNSLPGVVSATVTVNAPYTTGRASISAPGREAEALEAGYATAGPLFFATAGQRLVAGREFDGSPDDSQSSVIVNQNLAERLWPGGSAVGQSVVTYNKQRKTIVGVVANERCQHVRSRPGPCVYLPFTMGRSPGYVLIRSDEPPSALGPRLRRVVQDLAPNVAIAEETTLDAHLRRLTAADRMSAALTMGLALLAIVLLGAGCVSLFLSMVQDSRRELAIRIALGATRGSLWRRIVTQGLVVTLVGLAVGLGGARVVGTRIADQLYQVGPSDAVTLLAVSALVIVIGLSAVHWASRLAMRTNPARLLRAE